MTGKELYEKYKGKTLTCIYGFTGLVVGYEELSDDLIILNDDSDLKMTYEYAKEDAYIEPKYRNSKYFFEYLSEDKIQHGNKATIKTVEGGQEPIKSTKGSSCYDVFARKIEKVTPYYFKVYLGITSELPKDCSAELIPRSSITDTGWGMCNSKGEIDSDFPNEWQARFRPYWNGGNDIVFPYKVGDRVAQFKIEKDSGVEVLGVTILDNKRKDGHGSTGR